MILRIRRLLALALAFDVQPTGAATAGARLSYSKRGLVGVDNVHSYGDQATLIQASTLSWAYNYGSGPGNDSWFGNLEYVPQCWGGNDAPGFIANVERDAPNATHILAFNEPDGQGGGQATMSPAQAADLWKRYIDPLHDRGVKLGSPATTGSNGGVIWLQQFVGNCTGCHVDVLATHYYGEFQGLASHLGQLYYAFNATLKIWVTELADAHASYNSTVSNYDSMTKWLDGLDWVERYGWFGAFRSTDSNVGTNATFLDSTGNLTQIGRSYLMSAPQTQSASVGVSSIGTARPSSSATTTARSMAVEAVPPVVLPLVSLVALLLSVTIVL